MSAAKIWRPIPLQLRILEILDDAGSLSDDELLKALEKQGEEVSMETLNRTLLQMEVRGLIRVTNAPRGRRKIERKR
ncbi:MAG: hypothetical protein DRO46_00195 [Candidatus Hecatellales archaeon]|nr:MAG: hypothetical protein DRO46_00195 [Candidatus Hecatellales archaeon]